MTLDARVPIAHSAVLRRRTDQLSRHRLVTVVATAGWGKTSTIERLWPTGRCRWVTLDAADADELALARRLRAITDTDRATDPSGDAATDTADLAASLVRELDIDPRPVVLDDGHRLLDGSGLALLRRIADHPDRVSQLVVLARDDLRVVDDRRRAHGDVLELDARDLALDLDAIDGIVAHELDRDRALAARIGAATGGWPAAIQLVVDGLRGLAVGDRPAAVERLTAPDGPVGRYLDRVVLAPESPQARRTVLLLTIAPDLERQDIATLSDLDVDATRDQLDDLLARGLITTADADTAPVPPPALRRLARVELLRRLDPDGALVARTVRLLADRGAHAAALRVASESLTHDPTPTARLLVDHGAAILRAGELDLVLAAAASLPPDHRDPAIEGVRGEALAYQGHWSEALRALEAAGMPATGPLRADEAIRLGLIHYVSGDLGAALEAHERGPDTPVDATDPAPGVDDAVLASWRTTMHWLRGEREQTQRAAARAMRIADRLGDDRAAAYAHTAAALRAVDAGDRYANAAHYDQAIAAARRAGDQLQLARLLTNLGSANGEEGRYADAIAITEQAIDLAEAQGFRIILGVARCNRSSFLLRTGAVDEAIADAERAREAFAAIGSRTIAYAHHLLGAARAARGELVLATQAYDRALRSVGSTGDQQALIPTHLGMARVVATTDLHRATEAAERALQIDDGGLQSGEAHTTAAWIALARQDHDAVRDHARQARAMGERHGNPADVAEAETCLALLDDDPVAALDRASALWSAIDAPIWQARVELGLARRSDDPRVRSRIPALERRLVDLGCSLDRGGIEHVLLIGPATTHRIVVRTLGGFVVELDGRPVPLSAWGSRKARELLKVLAARSGRRTTREELGHLLWPDEPYDKVSNRLSVALSIIRGVLAPDDGDAASPLRTEGSGIALDPAVVDVDTDSFERLADAGLRAARDDPGEAIPLLLNAEERYGGDLLEDEPDLVWAEDRRAQLRATYLAVARMLARLVSRDDPDLAMRLLLRVLDRDGYDEPAHLNLCLALLRAGRHGEARRRYRLYEGRMAELDLPAVPFAELQREARVGEPATTAGGR